MAVCLSVTNGALCHKCVLWGIVFLSCLVSTSTAMAINQTNQTRTSSPLGTLPTTTSEPKKCSIDKDFWNICWLNSPPYVFNNNSKNETTVTGILIDALKLGLERCACPTKLTFIQVKSEEELSNCSLSDRNDLALPFPRKKASNYNWLFTLVESPNIYLILNRNSVDKRAKERVLTEFANSVWTIAVLTILLAIIFGIIVWFLDMAWNEEQFPPTFFPGSLEGVWWSFVTLTTVGYGDKTPKFPVARLFAIVWMFVGMVLVSLLTATMTKALTQAAFDNQDYLQSQKIGVIKHSYTYDEAVKNGAKPVEFSDLSEMYRALDEGTIAGILVDTFVATYVKNTPDLYAYKNVFFVARSFDASYPLAMYLARGAIKNRANLETFEFCFKTIFNELRQRQVYEIVEKYIQPPRIEAKVSKSVLQRIQFELYMFKSTEKTFIIGVQILGGTLGVLILLGTIWQIRHHHRSKRRSISMRGDKESIAMASHRPQDITNFNVIIENLNEVERAIGKLSKFKDLCEKYRKELQRYDNGIVNGVTTHAREAAVNKGLYSTS